MLDRASTFANPEVISLLQTGFVPVAIDQWYTRRQKDSTGEFWRKIAGQGPRSDFSRTTQGLYLADATGKLIAFNNNRGPERILKLLRETRDSFQPPHSPEVIERGPVDSKYSPQLPQGAVVARVSARVAGGYPAAGDPWQKIFQQAISRDNLWITAEEQAELLADRMPPELARRIARFHLVDNTRGEPPVWQLDEIRQLEFSLTAGRIEGTVKLETADGTRAFHCTLQGRIRKDGEGGRIAGLELLAEGKFRGTGPHTMEAPPDWFSLEVGFQLADGTDVADSIAPHASRGWLDGYLHPDH